MPRTAFIDLRSIPGQIRAYLVAAGFAVIALALATHLWQLNLSEIFDWLGSAFGPIFLLVDESGTVHLTEEMHRRIEFVDGVEFRIAGD